MPDMREMEQTDEERAASETAVAWSETPEGVDYLRKLLKESEESGPARSVNLEELRLKAIALMEARTHKAA